MWEFLGITPAQYGAMVLIALAGAAIKSTTGFGFALFTTPLLLFLFGPRQAVAYTTPLSLLIDLLIFLQTRRGANRRQVLRILLPALAGIPLGGLVLLGVPAPVLRGIIAGAVLLGAAAMLSGRSLPIRREGLASIGAGFLVGVLSGSTGMAGPPLALFMVNQGWSKTQMRAIMSTVFVGVGLTTLAVWAATGILTPSTLAVDGLLVPFVLGPYLLMARVVARLTSRTYHRLASGVAGLSALLALLQALLRARL